MSEERLQEIKDSIEFQYTLAKAKGYDNALLFTNEEEELVEEIERLTELCNKYEEEHKTTFETWQKDIKENKLLHSIIKEVREYIEENTKWYDKELGLVEMKGYNTNRIPVIYLYGLLKILDKENK